MNWAGLQLPAPDMPGVPAGLGRRFLATAVDVGLFCGAGWLFALVWSVGYAWLLRQLTFGAPIVLLLYTALLRSELGGEQTLGDRLLRVRVMTLERRPLSFHRSLARSVLGLLLLGYAFVIPFHPLGRGVHDILTRTIVVEGNYPDPVFVAAKHDPGRDRRIVAVAVSCAVVAAASALACALR